MDPSSRAPLGAVAIVAILALGACGGGDLGATTATTGGVGGAFPSTAAGGAGGSATTGAGGAPTSSGPGGAPTTTTTSAGGAPTSTTTAAGGAGGTTATAPDFDSLPWDTDPSVGYGVARKDAHNPLGENAFIGYAGYAVSLDQACAWVSALYHATLRDRGVRWVYCVQGPADPGYSNLEIGNSKIAAHLVSVVSPATKWIVAAAHSSGSFVAHELLWQLAGSHDPAGVTAGKVVYFDLDGGTSGLTDTSVARLAHAYFVGANDAATGTLSPNFGDMQAGAGAWPAAGGFVELDASASGCAAGAKWCVHMTLITHAPHDPSGPSAALDYTDFAGRPVVTDYLDAKSAEAGLVP